MIVILIAVGFLFIGIALGYLSCKLSAKAKASGTIYVTQGQGKTVYTLELDDYPETLVFKKKVIFKVDASQSQDRD
jgi:hypothetical protein